jgi:hypothetical protein
MDWWYDFLSRHPQVMASKPEWLRRGKVNDQYIRDVQSGKLRCTKFRRALLSAIQYMRSLNDAASKGEANNNGVVHFVGCGDFDENMSSPILSDLINDNNSQFISASKTTTNKNKPAKMTTSSKIPAKPSSNLNIQQEPMLSAFTAYNKNQINHNHNFKHLNTQKIMNNKINCPLITVHNYQASSTINLPSTLQLHSNPSVSSNIPGSITYLNMKKLGNHHQHQHHQHMYQQHNEGFISNLNSFNNHQGPIINGRSHVQNHHNHQNDEEDDDFDIVNMNDLITSNDSSLTQNHLHHQLGSSSHCWSNSNDDLVIASLVSNMDDDKLFGHENETIIMNSSFQNAPTNMSSLLGDIHNNQNMMYDQIHNQDFSLLNEVNNLSHIDKLKLSNSRLSGGSGGAGGASGGHLFIEDEDDNDEDNQNHVCMNYGHSNLDFNEESTEYEDDDDLQDEDEEEEDEEVQTHITTLHEFG